MTISSIACVVALKLIHGDSCVCLRWAVALFCLVLFATVWRNLPRPRRPVRFSSPRPTSRLVCQRDNANQASIFVRGICPTQVPIGIR